ncbi:hypothetical protein J2X48_000741 [Bosea sp. BE271]|uniref:hypothetical protein n=1 Tax=Bosea TaxID=85413 RepID=UPI00285EF219|nr:MULTISPECIES: hypothetical protein [Bosea]MDR6826455.1 hypothetical protein [Bosea robiniae]MDR6893165.1 hypothetical protein [Bosea sp. BE109]MDR7137136.1 hypothetical protein [Bosea sp. BE168]MDR7173835.1 hypothetical protein [Bosea sp. BE271]
MMRPLRKAAQRIAAWVIARRVERRNPELVALRKAEAEARRQHKPVKPIHDTRRAIVIANLRMEQGITR